MVDSDSHNRSRRRPMLELIALLTLLFCLPPLYIVWQTRRDNLVLRAERMISLPYVSWNTWINTETLLLIKSNTDIYRFNTSANALTSLPHAALALKQRGNIWPASVVPTKSVLVVLGVVRLPGKNEMGYIQLDGNTPDRWMKTDAVDWVWLDSESFISLTNSPKGMILNKYTTGGVKSELRSVNAVTGPPLLTRHPLIGASKGHAIGISIERSFNPRTQLILFDVYTSDTSPLRSHIVTLPERSKLWGMSLSPDGNRIAWLLETKPEYNTGLVAKLYQRLGMVDPKMEAVGVWVSDVKGEAFSCLGHVSTTTLQTGAIHDSLRWTPDGSHLSLYFKHHMYILKPPQ